MATVCYFLMLEGQADEVLRWTDLSLVSDERWLVGVSLAGLFAIWAAAESSLFTRVGSVSGSFWYPGFTEWLAEQDLHVRFAYLSLGDKEAGSRNPHLRDIAVQTETIAGILASKNVRTTFEWTEGSHFGPLLPRLEKVLSAWQDL